MRRPTPLPPPPGGGRPDVAPLAGAPAASGTGADQQDTGPIAPLIPLGPPDAAATPRADSAADPSRRADASADRTPERLGFRDIWRAARARRRALRAEVRRFTVRQRRRRIAWLAAAGGLVLLVVGTVGVAYSPLFALEHIEVVGTSQLPADTVSDALSEQLGTPLAAIDESAVKAALVAFPLVESYTLEAAPPHDLVVRIVERTPVGVVSSPAGYSLVDAAGVALSTSADPPPGYPELDVTGGIQSDAFAAAGRIMRSLPADMRAQVTLVSASSPDDVRLTLAGAAVVWGSPQKSALKAVVLQDMMAAQPGRSEYDVSSPNAIVVR